MRSAKNYLTKSSALSLRKKKKTYEFKMEALKNQK